VFCGSGVWEHDINKTGTLMAAIIVILT